VNTADGLITNSNVSSGTFTAITGIGTQTQALNMNTNLINGVTDPVVAQDAATKNFVETTALLLSGGLMTGDIDMDINGLDFDEAADATIGNPSAGDIRLYNSDETTSMVIKDSSGNKKALGSATLFVVADGATAKEKMMADFICDNVLTLVYDGGTGGVPNPTDTVTGTTTGATANIVSVSGDDVSGTLTINTFGVDVFQNNEPITAPTNSFAAVADGSNVGDEVQIQAAIDELTAGGEVILSGGTFTIAQSLEWKTDNFTLRGSNNTTIQGYGQATTPFIKDTNTTLRARWRMENFRLSAISDGGGTAVALTDLIQGVMKDVKIAGHTIGLDFTEKDGIYNRFEGCDIRVAGAGSICIDLDGSATNDNTFISCRLTGDSNTVKIRIGTNSSSLNNKFYGCHMDGTCSIAVKIGADARFNLWSGCWLAELATTGIELASGSDQSTFIGCNISVSNGTDITDNGSLGTSYIGCNKDGTNFTEVNDWELNNVDQIIFDSSQLNNGTPAAGQITVAKSMHSVNTGSSAQTVDEALTPSIGRILILRASSSSNDLTVTSSSGVTGEFILTGDASAVLANTRDSLMLIGISATQWIELSRSITGL